MKPSIYTLVAAVVICGCGQRPGPTEIRLAEVEGKTRELETRVAAMDQRVEAALDVVSNTTALVQLILTESRRFNIELSGMMEKQTEEGELLRGMLMSLTNRVTFKSNAPVPGQTAAGIPADVYAAIRASAAKRWNGEYDMQVYEINKQVEAYQKLHANGR